MHRGKKCVQLGKGDIPPYVLCAELTDCGTETLLTPTKQAGEKGSHVKRRRSRGLLHLFLPWNKNLRRAAGKNIEKCSLCLVINFQVRAGEVLGFAGLVGAGRTEIMQGIYGIAPADSGEIYVEGKKVVNRSPREGLNHGIAMVTEDRLRQGVVKKMNVQLNMTLSYFYRICKAGIINTNRENEDTDKMIRELHVKTAGREMPIWSLSGGNQQKVMIGRALLTNPKVLIMDEPTRGVDVGAKSEIYDYCNMLAKEGMAIILISSDLPEVMGMSDRMVVVREGRIVAEHERDTVTAEQVMSEMFGLTTAQKPEV